MSETKSPRLNSFTVTASKEQLEQLNKAWKRKNDNSRNRSDFVRAAINAYSGERIF